MGLRKGLEASVSPDPRIGIPLPSKEGERYYPYASIQFDSGVRSGEVHAVPTMIGKDSATAQFAIVNNDKVVHRYGNLQAFVVKEEPPRAFLSRFRRSPEPSQPTYTLTLRSKNEVRYNIGYLKEKENEQSFTGITAASPEDVLRVAPLILAKFGQDVVKHAHDGDYYHFEVEDRQRPRHNQDS